jgi:hypothetical protein
MITHGRSTAPVHQCHTAASLLYRLHVLLEPHQFSEAFRIEALEEKEPCMVAIQGLFLFVQ